MKKIKKIIAIVFFSTLLLNCSNDLQEQNYYSGAPTDFFYKFTVSDLTSQDLLNPEIIDSYDFDDMKLYYVKNGHAIEVYEKNLTYPRRIALSSYLIEEEGKEDREVFYLATTLYGVKAKEGIQTTIIEWSDSKKDSIKAYYKLDDSNSNYISKIHINNELYWEIEDGKLIDNLIHLSHD